MTEVTADRVISKLSALNLHLSPEINYRLETMFPKLDGMFVNRGIKKKFQLVQQSEPLLKKMLLEHEQVLFVSEGRLDFQKIIIVLTNLRLLWMHNTGGKEPSYPFWTIYYSQIDDLKKTFLQNPKFCLKDGTKLRLNDFPKQEHETLRDVFQEAAQRFQEEGLDPPVSQSCENLCGNCFKIVSEQTSKCDACGAIFWTPFEMGIRGLIFPPWGSFTIRPYYSAFGELISYASIMFGVLILDVRDDLAFAILAFVLLNSTAAVSFYKLTAKGLYVKELPENK